MRGPCHKDDSMLGYILGSPSFAEKATRLSISRLQTQASATNGTLNYTGALNEAL